MIGSNDSNSFATVYPNPARELINVKLTSSKHALFELFSLEGKLVLRIELLGGENNISLQGIKPSAYLYKVSGLEKGGSKAGSLIILK